MKYENVEVSSELDDMMRRSRIVYAITLCLSALVLVSLTWVLTIL